MLSSIEAIRDAESKLMTQGVSKHPGVLPSLLSHLAVDSVSQWPLHTAALHSLRRVFTHLHHGGQLQARSGGLQLERDLCHWLQQQFSAYLGLLGRLLVEGGSGGPARVEARVLALSTVMHFCVHGAPLSLQGAAGGPFVCQPVVVWLTRLLLAAGGPGSQPLYSGSSAAAQPPAALLPLLTSSLAGAGAAYRSQFLDDYDDMRLAGLKAIRDVCRERQQALGSGGSEQGAQGGASRKRQRTTSASAAAPEAAAGTEGMGGEALSRALLAAAHCSIVASNALDLLLAITLPATQKAWDETPRASWGEEQLGEALKGARSSRPGAQQAVPAAAAAAATATAAAASAVKYFVDSEDEGDAESGALKAMASASAAAPAPSSSSSKHSYAAQCKAYGEAFLALLALPLSPECYRRVLLALPRRVLPLLPPQQALQLADFLTHACAAGGASALLALESLFLLQQRHGLEFPRFYTFLYALLGAPATAHAKYRPRFFSQLDLYMTSSALPAYLVAAFAKRALRVALTAPVGVALFALPFVYNLLKRHATLLPLLHRAAAAGSTSGSSSAAWPGAVDPYLPGAEEPSASNAQGSSLWEVMALAQHSYAPVAHAARVLLGPLSREEFDLSEDGRSGAAGGSGSGSGSGEGGEELRTSTYGAMAERELGREVRRGGGEGTAPVAVAFAFAGSASSSSFQGVVDFAQ